MFSKPFKPLTIKTIDGSSQSNNHPSEPIAKRRKLSPSEDNFPKSAPDRKSASHISSSSDLPRKPLKPIENSSSSPEDAPPSTGTGLKSFYSILWRLPTAKKHKIWTGDGFLSVADGQASLFDGNGRSIGRTACSRPLLPGSNLAISGKEVEIDSCVSREEFLLAFNKGAKSAKSVKENKSVPSKAVSTTKTPEKSTTAKRKADQDTVKSKSSKQPDKTQVAVAKEPIAARDQKAIPTVAREFRQPFKHSTILSQDPSGKPVPRHDPNAPGSLIFPRPKDFDDTRMVDIVLDPLLSIKLREHQREGVKFLYECVMGYRDFNGQGCILADEMGLGKTLQTISLLWTLIKQNPVHRGGPVVKKALIVCPVSLTRNWKNEFRKWLGGDRLGVLEYENQKTRIGMFDGKTYNVMIIGYERLRMVADDLTNGSPIDIVICDEGHRLKTIKNKSAKAIELLNTPRRVLLSGTPIQNDLNEFYAMANFVNEGCLGSAKAFARDFEVPIMKSRQPDASEEAVERGQEASEELGRLTGSFILRRTADILSDYLPPKHEFVLFCNPTPQQATIYRNILKTPLFQRALGSNETALQMITILKKLCNSPTLLSPNSGHDDTSASTSLSLLSEMLPSGLSKLYRNAASTKIRVLDEILQQIRSTTEEKVVLVSNYTSTLDIMESLLINSGLSFLRLDGTVPANKRQALVDEFNRSKSSKTFAFLLSAKAGGVGINLVGASRLVLFDVDWNPATDAQAIGRIYRQGQKLPCHIYRLLLKGTLEERIWQRQIVKKGLADSIMDGNGSTMTRSMDLGFSGKTKGKAVFSQDELRDLFSLDTNPGLRTHDLINCKCDWDGPDNGTGAITPIADGTISREESEVIEIEDDEELPELDELLSRAAHAAQDSKGQHTEDVHIKTPQTDDNVPNDNIEELMKYAHLDLSRTLTSSEDLKGRIGDSCLANVISQHNEDIGGGIAYIFKRTSGAKLAAAVVAE